MRTARRYCPRIGSAPATSQAVSNLICVCVEPLAERRHHAVAPERDRARATSRANRRRAIRLIVERGRAERGEACAVGSMARDAVGAIELRPFAVRRRVARSRARST